MSGSAPPRPAPARFPGKHRSRHLAPRRAPARPTSIGRRSAGPGTWPASPRARERCGRALGPFPTPPERAGQPRRHREMSISLVCRPAVNLGEPAQTLQLEQLCRPLQFGEVLLDARIWQVRQDLRSKPLDCRPQFAHAPACLEHTFGLYSPGTTKPSDDVPQGHRDGSTLGSSVLSSRGTLAPTPPESDRIASRPGMATRSIRSSLPREGPEVQSVFL